MPSSEIATSAILRDAFRQGKRVFVPYTHDVAVQTPSQPRAVMDMFSLDSEDDYRALTPDKWGIPTPSEDSIRRRENCFGGIGVDDVQPGATGNDNVGLDLVVMPGMAFDSKMARLGHGKGFYDYFLQRHHERLSVMKTKMPFLGISTILCTRSMDPALTCRVRQLALRSKSSCLPKTNRCRLTTLTGNWMP